MIKLILDIMKREYVLGFAFDRNKQNIVLIEKQKPNWQKGLYNGVGGKIESFDITPTYAMIREFEEETSVKTSFDMWDHFSTMYFSDSIVYCFRMFSNIIYQVKTNEKEKVSIFSLYSKNINYEKIQDQKIINNLNVFIPMAVDEDFKYCDIKMF